MCKQIKQELEDLIYLREENRVITLSKLGQFNVKEPVEKLELNIITADVQYFILMLWSFLMALV